MSDLAKCPVCDGAGHVSRPPHVAGDVPGWSASSTVTYACRPCDGRGYITLNNAQPPRTGEPQRFSDISIAIVNLMNASRAGGFARGRGDDDTEDNRAESRAIDELKAAIAAGCSPTRLLTEAAARRAVFGPHATEPCACPACPSHRHGYCVTCHEPTVMHDVSGACPPHGTRRGLTAVQIDQAQAWQRDVRAYVKARTHDCELSMPALGLACVVDQMLTAEPVDVQGGERLTKGEADALDIVLRFLNFRSGVRWDFVNKVLPKLRQRLAPRAERREEHDGNE